MLKALIVNCLYTSNDTLELYAWGWETLVKMNKTTQICYVIYRATPTNDSIIHL